MLPNEVKTEKEAFCFGMEEINSNLLEQLRIKLEKDSVITASQLSQDPRGLGANYEIIRFSLNTPSERKWRPMVERVKIALESIGKIKNMYHETLTTIQTYEEI